MSALALGAALVTLTPLSAAQASGPRQVSSAGLAAPTDKPGQPTPPADPPPPPKSCDLQNPDSPRDEFAQCITADVNLDSRPGVGETAQGVLTVKSELDVKDATVTLRVNDNLSMATATGFATAGTEPSGVGPVATLTRHVTLTAGQTRTFPFTVRAESKGYGVVQAEVSGGDARSTASDETAVELGGPSAPSPTGGLAVSPVPAGATPAPASSPAKYTPASVGGPASLAPGAPGASCATGGWFFNNEQNQSTPSVNVWVQVWDQDSSGGDDFLASGVTDGSGHYNVCFESTDTDQGGGQEVYVKFVTENAQWRVRDTAGANNNYVWSTGVQAIPDPGTANFGNLQPADASLHRALHAFDGIDLLFLWHVGVTLCLDNPGQCRQLIVNWTPTSTDGTYYSLAGNDVHLAAANPDADHITIHEGSHALMDAIYNDAFPSAPNCNPHSIFGTSSEGCAWTEGWAEWVPAEVLQDPFFRWDNGASLNLETPGWTDGQVQGDTAEGRIAGALIDLSDNTNEAPWDRYGEDEAYGAQFEEIFTTSNLEVSNTFNEYFNTDRPGEGDTGFLARTAVFANTIDYTQRDPLFNLSPLTRPSLSVAPSPHNYSFNTVSGYWSGVAVRGANDNDLTVYDDAGQTASLASSAFGGSTIDYVLVDSNERSLGDYYPRVNLFAGSGPYDVEWAAGATSFAEGSTPVSFGTGDVIQVRDAFAAGGVTNYVRVVPSAGLDLDLFAHDSTSGTPATYVQGRPAAVASSASGGLGAPEAIQYTVPETDWTGLVLLNKSGSGTATVYRDQSAPTGASVVIDSGAATTYDRQVDLGLSAADSQTGIMDMRVSVDGTFDTETFEPYATSKSVTLPTGDGTKTVKVEFRNNAGAVTQASDTIDLHEATVPSAPTVTSSTPRPQQIAVAFTPGSDGGAPVSNFTAQCVSTDGGITKSVGGAASPITVTGLSDQKSYHCHVRATNPVGTGAWSAYGATVVLPAPTAPDAPTVTDTTPGAGKATVAFSPGFNGGSPVTNFTAQCVSTDGGVTKSAGRAASPITVTGLSPLKSYHCRVRATNAVGVGAWSGYGSTVAVQATVPGAPTVTSTTPGPSRATVGFTPGSDGGSPITNFTAQCVSTDGGVTKSAGGPASPITVTALTAGHTYHCHVRATNAVGTGTWSGYGSSIPVSATAPQSSATQRWLMTTGRL